MKKIFLITVFLTLIAASKNSGAQPGNDEVIKSAASPVHPKANSTAKKEFKKTKSAASVSTNVLKDFIRSNKNLTEIKVTSVNIKAVRDFSRTYNDVPDVKWFKTEGGFIASFSSKGVDTKIVYDDKGSWFYNLLSYTEANMAFNIRDLVKSRYYDDNILVVYQYEFGNKTVYVIRMQDHQSNIVTLKVCDGEIENITNGEKK